MRTTWSTRRYILLIVVAPALVLAGFLELNWYSIDSGGARSTGGTYELVGTIGQIEQTVMSGSNYEIVGGFWAGTVADCDANGIDDAEDIANCAPGDPDCSDCNLNGVPDACDIAAGDSEDIMPPFDEPDECSNYVDNCPGGENIWSCAENWENNIVPNNNGETFSVTLDNLNIPGSEVDNVNLDIEVEIDTLRILQGATLTVSDPDNDGDLAVVEAGGIELFSPVDMPPSLLTMGNGRTLSVPLGPLDLGPGGRFGPDPAAPLPVTASAQIDAVHVHEGACVSPGPGQFAMNGNMSAAVQLLNLNAVQDPPDVGCCPPEFRVQGDAAMTAHDVIMGGASITYSSSQPFIVTGNFVNSSAMPEAMDWINGGICLGSCSQPGVVGSTQSFEVAGRDLGLNLDGFVDNFAIGTLEIDAGATVNFLDLIDNHPDDNDEDGPCTEALYVGTLILREGCSVTLESCNIYCVELIDEGAETLLPDCGQIIMIDSCEEPCDDGDACTVGDDCSQIACAGQPVDCTAFDDDCSVTACDPQGATGNCDMITPHNEGGACASGTGFCEDGSCVPVAETTRLFMGFDGDESAVAAAGPTDVYMSPGSTARVTVYIEDNSPDEKLLNAYQVMVPYMAEPMEDAVGTVGYVDLEPGLPNGDSAFLNIDRSDWVFADEIVLPVSYNETSPEYFGVFYATLPDVTVELSNSGGLWYLMEFEIAASPDASGTFELSLRDHNSPAPVTTLFQPGGAAFSVDQFQTLRIHINDDACVDVTDCADVDNDGIRDDPCVWTTCVNGACYAEDVVYGEMGGPNGGCQPDGAADSNDRFHALNCFSDQDTTGTPGYACEDAPPTAYNVDMAGIDAPCVPDGVCDANDAFAALNAFEGDSTCFCGPQGPAPLPPAPFREQFATLTLQSSRPQALPGEVVEVDVYLDAALADLRGYQLHVAARGGSQGTLELIDAFVGHRKDSVFARQPHWEAYNIKIQQMAAGLDGAGTPTQPRAYLATFSFRISADAEGVFEVVLLADPDDPSHRSVLFPSSRGGVVRITGIRVAEIQVQPRSPVVRKSRGE